VTRLSDCVTQIKGIGEKKAGLLARLNIEKVEDFLYFYPRDYQDRRSTVKIDSLTPGKAFLIRARVALLIKNNKYYARKRVLRLLVDDGSASLEVVFFNAKYLENTFKQGAEYFFYGKITADEGKKQMIHPEFMTTDGGAEKGIIPIYPLTAGISQLEMRKWQRAALDSLDQVCEYMPPEIMERNRLCSIGYALENIHFPLDGQKLKEAKFRLIFDELFLLQAGLMAVKISRGPTGSGIRFSKDADVGEFISEMPFRLTRAQSRVIGEVMGDMESGRLMNRLVQGDVGCGKTAVAEAALYKACMSGYQGVLMAPTELLARQHYDTIRRSFSPFGIEVSFLSGNLGQKERRETLASLADGKTGILVGTHAVIQEDVVFNNLGLVITDEQHRFGVNQRALLAGKGARPDVIVMSATPIPRTLAMILYGDLDISVIDELPPGRRRTVTRAVGADQREASYAFIKREIQSGKQAYVVAPLIDDSDVIDARSAESIYKDLISRFGEFNVALLHGEMKQKEKDGIMEGFRNGDIHVLISTVVIEVGINIPNASIMLIENSERFGLAQLHQLRGRVGRGAEDSYCILITEGDSKLAAERANTMVRTTDGFEIAEMDLKLRGPGDIFGIRQHGLADFRIADLLKHMNILETVREEAKNLLESDNDLSMPSHAGIKERIDKQFEPVL